MDKTQFVKGHSTIRDNLLRWLRFYGFADVEFVRVEEDRAFVRDPGGRLLEFAEKNQFLRDPGFVVKRLHPGAVASYREPYGCHPALQICVHPQDSGGPLLELDFDYAAPADVVGAVWHLVEVLYNHLSGEVTDQDIVAAMLDHRGIPRLDQTG